MKQNFLLALSLVSVTVFAEPLPSPSGVSLPAGYQNWRLLAVSQRTENQTLRAILGNDVAIAAARAGKTNPWPDGAILAKVNWKQKVSERFATANVPGELIHVDFMVKDAAKYATTSGWGWARWLGPEQKVYGTDASFAQECVACHNGAKDRDMVFTDPVKLP